jgi:hypothetical protein
VQHRCRRIGSHPCRCAVTGVERLAAGRSDHDGHRDIDVNGGRVGDGWLVGPAAIGADKVG